LKTNKAQLSKDAERNMEAGRLRPDHIYTFLRGRRIRV